MPSAPNDSQSRATCTRSGRLAPRRAPGGRARAQRRERWPRSGSFDDFRHEVQARFRFRRHRLKIGAAVGFVVYLLVFILGMSFASREMVHIVVDILWQMLEQGLGGLMVSFGLMYDMHRTFMDAERAK